MDTSRLEAFSDAVIAIAITLLVLEIKVPHSTTFGLGSELLSLWPSYLAYAISFIVIGAIWINHHVMFKHIVRADEMLLLLNTLQLMFIAFLPFPTAVLAESLHSRADEPVATAFYGCTLAVIGMLVVTMWAYAAHNHQLLSGNISREEAKHHGCRLLVGPAGYIVATLTALVAPWLALIFFIALNVYFLWPRHRQMRSKPL
jgi:uncharacterized membrane protein